VAFERGSAIVKSFTCQHVLHASCANGQLEHKVAQDDYDPDWDSDHTIDCAMCRTLFWQPPGDPLPDYLKKGLNLHGVWADAVINAGKCIENRKPTVSIPAGLYWIRTTIGGTPGGLPGDHIVGLVRIGSPISAESATAEQQRWLIANMLHYPMTLCQRIAPYRYTPRQGSQTIFTIDDSTSAALLA
jgi:hypothetical protein